MDNPAASLQTLRSLCANPAHALNHRFRLLLGALLSLVFLDGGNTSALAKWQSGGLTMEQRVDYQRRIEEVYWRHRTENLPGAQRTAFRDAIQDEAIREKVEEALRKSTALATVWQRPITAAQLQAEVARMAANSRQAEFLRELWRALDNDRSRSPNAWRARSLSSGSSRRGMGMTTAFTAICAPASRRNWRRGAT